MKKISAFLLFFSSVALFGQNSQSTEDKRIVYVIDSVAHAFMQNSARVGLSIGVTRNGKSYIRHYGTIKKNTNQIPTDQTLYEIGSITKTFTGTLLAQAVKDKKVNLDDDVRKFLGKSYNNLQYNEQPIRLSHLLNHSSGLPFMLPDTEALFKKYENNDSLPLLLSQLEKNYTKEQFMNDLRKVKIDTIPGIKLKYSNTGAQLLAIILEQVYKLSYEELLKKYITAPLKMNETFLTIPSKNNVIASGYNDKGMLAPRSLSGAAGGIYSTVPDMLKYARFHLDEKQEVVKLTHTPTWGDPRYYAMGLNWQMQFKPNEPKVIFQSGGTAGFSSNLVLYPELNLGIVLLSNESDRDSQGELSKSAQLIFKELLKEKF